MCDPVTFTVLTVAAGAMQAYGQYQEGQSKSNMYKYQAALAVQKAALVRKTAESNVTAVQDAAAQESKELSRENARLIGTQRATMGALGIGGVTAEDIATSTFDKARLDQMAIRYKANVKSYNIMEEAKSEAWALEEEGKQYEQAAKNARRAANINVTTTLLSTAATTALASSKLFPKKTAAKPSYAAPADYYKSSSARIKF